MSVRGNTLTSSGMSPRWDSREGSVSMHTGRVRVIGSALKNLNVICSYGFVVRCACQCV